jgi:hypothetical protein
VPLCQCVVVRDCHALVAGQQCRPDQQLVDADRL